ncbi:MAG: class I SAM-dependent methyltransferase [Pseudomonadota bacterium]|nr:class I SAM-dependent methyltransferase [Pseudomonadota bacterium]
MYCCPRTGGPLKDWHSVTGQVTYPMLDGVPVLLVDPVALLSSHPPRSPAAAEATRCGLPDPITPHLPPSLFGAPSGFGQWLTSLGEVSPDSIAAGFAAKHAPPGAALDVGCGVGTMARRMVTSGRATWAFDRSPDAVLLAKGLLCGTLQQTVIPTSRRGLRRVKVPFKPITANLEICIADASRPPFPPGSFAWVHLGDVLDELGDDVGDVLVACEGMLKRGGLLTLSTSYGAPTSASETSTPPEEELLEALEGLGLQVIDQQDRVPQVSRDFDRGYRVRFMHIIAARKK